MIRSRLVIRSVATLAALAAASSVTAQGGRQLFGYIDCNNSYYFGGLGTSVAVIGDVNGDGRSDIAVGDPFHDYYGPSPAVGRVLILSGDDGALIRSCSANVGTGQLVAALGDVDGDQVPDVLACTRPAGGYGSGYGAHPGPQAVTVFSGATGAAVHTLGFASASIVGVGDWSGDSVPDFAVENAGAVEVYSGASAALVTTLATTAASMASLPASASGARLLVVGDGSNLVSVYDSGGVIQWSRQGYRGLADAGDVDGDGLHDVVARTPQGAAVEVLSGFDGSTLLTLPGGGQVAGGVDLDGDLVPDVAVGDRANNIFHAYSGATGALLFSREGWMSDEAMGSAVAMSPGVGTPPRPAVLAGAPQRSHGCYETGWVVAVAQAAPGEVDGDVEILGTGCNYLNWDLKVFNVDPPKAGGALQLRLEESNGQVSLGMWNLHVFGTSNTSYNGVALPVLLPSPGLQCSLEVAPELVLLNLAFPGTGVNLAIPNNSAVVGSDLFFQAVTFTAYQGLPFFETSQVAKAKIGN